MSGGFDPASAGPARVYLPSRRVNHSEAIDWNGVALLVTVGFDAEGAGREIFVEGLMPGCDAEIMLDDAVILASMLLQHGYRLETLFAKLMRVDTQAAAARFKDENTGIRKPSMIAAIIAAAVKIEAEQGDAVAILHRKLGAAS